MSLPSPIIAVLAHFRPLFTAPTWKKAVTLLIGTLLGRGRRTVTAALRQMGHQMDGHFSLFHQVLNRARWSSLAVSKSLLQVLVQTFVSATETEDWPMRLIFAFLTFSQRACLGHSLAPDRFLS